MAEGLAASFARFATELRFEELPAAARAAAADVLADTVAAMVGGAAEAQPTALRAELVGGEGGEGDAVVLAAGLPRVEPGTAAFLNATAGTTLEVDEWHPPSGHPAVHALPVALALGEAHRAAGPRLLTALIASYELAAQVEERVELRPGHHPHGAIGAVAAALGGGLVAGLTPVQIAQAVGIAASMMPVTSYAACYQGATVRNAYAGEGARLAVTAVRLARAGYSADPLALEAAIERAASSADLAAVRPPEAGEQPQILRNQFKLDAVCGLSLAPLDALRAALAHGLADPAAVRAVRLTVTPRTTSMDSPRPANDLAAKFSLPYQAAVLMLHGRVDEEAFMPRLLADPEVAALADRVELRGDEALRDGEAAAVVELSGGGLQEGRCERPRGRFDNPASPSALHEKWARLLARGGVVDPQRALASFRAAGEVREIGELWNAVETA